ncbi:MAG: hypothetical protein K8R87_07090 [Verrucomicrobia bacterium]|nr:hypothetical protein [Verrucomicrobiota bacterium]
MNTTPSSIHPGMKALVAGCSLALLSAFVWYSHTQAQSKSTSSQVTQASPEKAKTDGATKGQSSSSPAAIPPVTPQPVTQEQRQILLLGTKSYTGTTIVKPGTLNELGIVPDPKAKNVQPQSKQTAGDSPKSDAPKGILMSGSKSGILTTSNLAPVSKDSQNSSQPVQTDGKSSQPDKPKDILMFSSKAMSQPVFSTRNANPDSQKAAPPAQQQKPEQK